LPSWAVAKANIYIITAILGTTISPYLFFWQASQEIEDQIEEGNDTEKKRALAGEKNIKNMRMDVAVGMFFSNLIMFFIIAVCAETLFKNGITDINGAGEAAEALRPLAGNFAYLLFSLGILGTGLLALPVLAGSSAYAISETFGWREGLYRKWNKAKAFYSVIAFSMLLGLSFSFLNINPIKSLVYSAVLNGIVAPIIIFFLIILSQSGKVMGERKNKPITNVFGWLLTVVMGAVAIFTIVEIAKNGL
jgi:Mn2+/Fe2+ NRAMP family transporter